MIAVAGIGGNDRSSRREPPNDRQALVLIKDSPVAINSGMTTDSPKASDHKSSESKLLVESLTDTLRATTQSVVPWFLENMPLAYFQDTSEDARMSHLRAIIGAKAAGRPIEFVLRSEDGSQWTAVQPKNRPGVVAEQASNLPVDRHLRAAKIHAAADGNLVLVTFEFGEAPTFDPQQSDQAAKLDEILSHAAEHCPDCSIDDLKQHARHCSAEYILNVSPFRFCEHYRLDRQIRGRAGTRVVLEAEDDPHQSRITIALTNVTTRRMLERITQRLRHADINLQRAYLDEFREDDGENVVIFGFVVQGPDGDRIVESSELWRELRYDLLRNKWLDHRSLDLAYRHPGLWQRRAEILTAFADLVQQKLIKINPYAFNADRIMRLLELNLAQSQRVADLFLERFRPESPTSEKVFKARAEDLASDIDEQVGIEDARVVLKTMLDAVGAVLRTNVHLEERFALSMRLDPAFLQSEDRVDLPYGVFFVHGRSFNGFHVRFRDISRGGMRVIRPRHADQHAAETERLYDEAYGLASAQQLKNKDIPEGGSKAAVLVHPDAKLNRAIKGFVDSILDLITPDPETRRRVVDYFGEEELLYLGPDENIQPRHINWIIDRARYRGYPNANAFMSSKPGAGINHKQYGVTSEGVNVFLAVALRAVGIEPTRQPFTVKITGGPDGDVGGNMLRILHRDYGENARITGIADGSGIGEDPEGLDYEELMRLFVAERPIAEFDRSKLHPGGRIVAVDDPNGVHLRNTLHNRLVADAFVPAGGRPNTIHEGNWRDYLTPTGEPSSKVIIEGANLFLTPEARRRLSESGALVLKDSSANKCGVICSSYEIMASMLLDEHGFLAIKDRFAEQVLERLRDLARREAELLLRIRRHQKGVPLPEMSIRLSQMMIRAADAIETSINEMSREDADLFRQLVVEHVPPVLLEQVGERLWRDVPTRYLNWIMAKSLAARIVYREGYRYLEAMPIEGIADMARHYLRMDLERARLASEVLSSELPSKQRIAQLLARAGVMATLGEEN
jgi:glutamate dehydrogenase